MKTFLSLIRIKKCISKLFFFFKKKELNQIMSRDGGSTIFEDMNRGHTCVFHAPREIIIVKKSFQIEILS